MSGCRVTVKSSPNARILRGVTQRRKAERSDVTHASDVVERFARPLGVIRSAASSGPISRACPALGTTQMEPDSPRAQKQRSYECT